MRKVFDINKLRSRMLGINKDGSLYVMLISGKSPFSNDDFKDLKDTWVEFEFSGTIISGQCVSIKKRGIILNDWTINNDQLKMF